VAQRALPLLLLSGFLLMPPDCGFQTAGQIKLSKEVLDMNFHRRIADTQLPSYRLIIHAFGEALEDFGLALSEVYIFGRF
jgi:hypothetical protein